jgi:cytochrome c553
VLLGLTTGQEIGLLVFAGIFIAFSLAASFLFPQRNPDWPGRRLGSFIAVTAVLFVAMMTAVFVLARESEEEGAHAEPPAETVTPANPEESSEGPGAGEGAEQGEPGATGETSGEQGGTSSGDTGTSGSVQGDPAAGKQVFASAGCGGCHTLADAGASGNVGPNLDEAQPDHELAVERVTNGKAPMPAFKDQLSEKQIQDVAAYVVDATGGS